MKKLNLLMIVLLFGVVACNSDNKQVTEQENASEDMADVEGVNTDSDTPETTMVEEKLITPADMPEEMQSTMYQTIFDYNRCMMSGRLDASQGGVRVQEAANAIMDKCDAHLTTLEKLLFDNKVNEALTLGMSKRLRSKAARELMQQNINNMAAMAAAADNAKMMEEVTVTE